MWFRVGNRSYGTGDDDHDVGDDSAATPAGGDITATQAQEDEVVADDDDENGPTFEAAQVATATKRADVPFEFKQSKLRSPIFCEPTTYFALQWSAILSSLLPSTVAETQNHATCL